MYSVRCRPGLFSPGGRRCEVSDGTTLETNTTKRSLIAIQGRSWSMKEIASRKAKTHSTQLPEVDEIAIYRCACFLSGVSCWFVDL